MAQLVNNTPAMWETWVWPLGRSPGEGKGYPLQDSGLENSIDCIDHGVTESNTAEWLSLHYVINTYYLWSVSPSSLASWKCCLSFSLLNAALLLCNLHTQKEITSASCRMNKSGWIALISTFSWSPRLTSSETAVRLVVADLPSLKSSLDWRVWLIPGVPHQVPRIAVFRRELFSPSSFFGVSWLPSISESEQSKAIALAPQLTV